MRIIICDDDDAIVTLLQSYIIEFFKEKRLIIPKIDLYHCGEELLADSAEKDIVFLDVEMPGINGVSVGRELKRQNKNTIIFIVTSYTEYLDDAMRFHVFRYLFKPLNKERLFKNMHDAIQLYNSTNTKIPLETKDGVYSVCTSDIIFVEAQGRNTKVYTTKQVYTVLPKMNYWISVFDMPCFFHTHRSFIVNLQHVTDFDKTVIHLYNNKYTAYLTRRKYSEFKEAYLLYMESTR